MRMPARPLRGAAFQIETSNGSECDSTITSLTRFSNCRISCTEQESDVVQACHRIVDNDDRVRQIRNLLQ